MSRAQCAYSLWSFAIITVVPESIGAPPEAASLQPENVYPLLETTGIAPYLEPTVSNLVTDSFSLPPLGSKVTFTLGAWPTPAPLYPNSLSFILVVSLRLVLAKAFSPIVICAWFWGKAMSFSDEHPANALAFIVLVLTSSKVTLSIALLFSNAFSPITRTCEPFISLGILRALSLPLYLVISPV